LSRLALTNANLFDGFGPATAGATVVIDGRRIAAMGADVVADPDDTVIDLAGRTVMPGMVTCHFHSTYQDVGARPVPYGYDHAPAYQALLAADHLATALRCGYTGAVSAGAAFDVDPAVAQAIADGLVPGPRFAPGSRELSTTGHANDGVPWYWEHPGTAAMRVCNGPDEFRAAVREEVRRGARVIKLFVTGGHGTTAPKSRTEMTRDELAAAIDTAHERDVLIRGHITNQAAIMLAIELGIDVVDHCDDIDDEIVAALAERGTYVVPSIRLPEVTLERHGEQMGRAADAIRGDLARMYEMLPKADAAGVRILVGDDYGAAGLPHGAYGDELLSYATRCEVAPHDVLRWATVNGRSLLDRTDTPTPLAVGDRADLLVVDGDPTADIKVAADPARVVAVIKNGAVVSGALP
jgi:imidazolonepropionase-like amidohydrolase